MEEELLKLIDEFGQKLSIYQYNQYVIKLRDYLVPYLTTYHKNSDLRMILTNEFTRSDIINSTIYYIETNGNIKRISAIDDFLIALNRFFLELVFDKYHNQNLRNLVPFTAMSDEINNILISKGIELLERESNPPIDKDQYLAIIKYLRDYDGYGRLQSYQVPIIIKLMLLYGISHDRIATLDVKSYDKDRNLLHLVNPVDTRQTFNLELPYSFIEDFKKLFSFRYTKPELNADYLFVTEENNMISNSIIKGLLDKIRDKFQKDNDVVLDKNPFTATGLQKYAIINMILAGVNQTIITEFTGQKDDILNACQIEVNRENIIERNRYVNYKIRSIATYDAMQ